MSSEEITLADIQEQLNQFAKMMLNQKEVLDIDECAAYLGLKKSYLYKMNSSNTIPFYKPNGKKVFYKRTEIDEWLLSNRNKTEAEIETAASNHMIGISA